jgi:hypothetical protein
VVAALVRAGATLDSQWIEVDDNERRRAAKRVASDLRMQRALRGEVSE